MYCTDRGIEELADRRGEEEVTLAWLADRLQAFVDLNPEFEVPVERLATWLARDDDGRARLSLPLRRVTVEPGRGYDPDAWYWSIPAVGRSCATDGLTLDSGVTVLVGENGTGKSTLVEALAAAWRRRLTGAEVHHWGPVWTPEDEGRPGYTDLFRHLALDAERPPPQGGCFLRAEAMHAVFATVDTDAFELRAFDGVGAATPARTARASWPSWSRGAPSAGSTCSTSRRPRCRSGPALLC